MGWSRATIGGVLVGLIVGISATAAPQSAIVLAFDTGQVLQAQQPDRPWPPASLVKMMLTYVVLEAVQKGRVSLETPIRASSQAAQMGGSQVYLREGETFSLGELMAAVEIASANDAAVAVAEGVFGSQEAAVARMNAKARELGLTHTHYANVHGLPAGAPDANRTTARDAALLAQALIRDHPEVLRWTAQVQAPFRGGRFRLFSTNAWLLRRVRGADGLKTGYHRQAGYNLVATAFRDGMRLIAVVLGCASAEERSKTAARLLEQAFAAYERRVVLNAGQELPDLAYVAGSQDEYVPLRVAKPLVVVLPRGRWSALRFLPEEVPRLHAPVRAGDPAGRLVAVLEGKRLATVPLVVGRSVAAAPIWWRLLHGGSSEPAAGWTKRRPVGP